MKRVSVLLCLALAVPACDAIKKVKEFANAADKKSSSDSAEGGLVHNLTGDGYEDFTRQRGPLVIVDFYADWCGPCKLLEPMLDEMAGEFSDRVVVGKLNIDQYGEVAQRTGVNGIPDVRFFRDGEQVDQIVGLPSESELRSRIEQHAKGAVVKPKEKKAIDPNKPKEPTIQPMGKDWLPPGMEKK